MTECAYDDNSGGCDNGNLVVCVVCRQHFCKAHASLVTDVCGACEYNQADYERDYPDDMDAHTREEQILVMTSPEMWKKRPILPLRKNTGPGMMDCILGLMLELEGQQTTVHITNMLDNNFNVKSRLDVLEDPTIERKIYTSLNALLDDGWFVD